MTAETAAMSLTFPRTARADTPRARGAVSSFMGGQWQILLLSALFVAVVVAVAWVVVDTSQRRLIEFKTLNVAEVVARQAAEARSVYAEMAVSKLKGDGTGAHFEFASRPGYVPLPAQFFAALSTRASERSHGLYRFRPVSLWNLGERHALEDGFQRWAWANLESQDQDDPAGPIDWQPVWRIEDVDGVRTLRYMRADPAVNDACVNCHNQVEAEPATIARRAAAGVPQGKRWKRHQLMGAVEVNVPLNRATALAREQTQTGLLVVLGVALIVACGVCTLIVLDRSRRGQMAVRLAHQASHDSLTGLPNRVTLDQRLGQALNADPFAGLAVMLLDLDNFKEINDTLGHQMGDRVLEQVGRRLAGAMRDGDMVARLGGDEFALLMVGPDVGEAEAVARRITALLDEDFSVGDYRLVVGGSVGVVIARDAERDAMELLRCADVAMYAAKRSNQDCVVYSDEIDDNKLARLTFIKDLREAIRSDGLHLCYQPKVDLRRQRVVGVEALLRWNHPQLGPVPPQDIIPVAERTGLVRPLTEWVLDNAIRQCAEWDRKGIRLHVAVNLSVRNLEDPALAELVAQCLRRAGLPAHRLALEVTESAMMHDPERASATLMKLDAMGMRLSVDDFGTGYSSLGYLHRLPVHELKLDRRFVMQMNRSERDAAIVNATCEMAHALGLSVVAEGVENQQVLVMLRDLGCDVAQGFHLCRPLDAAAITEWLRAPGVACAPARLAPVSAG